MSQLTTHILDTTKGRPARGVTIILYAENNDTWIEIARGITNAEGRIPDLLKKDEVLKYGVYKMRFESGQYFNNAGVAAFYPYIEVVFDIASSEHYHIPLLLNPFGYSTYRGS